MTAPAVKQIAFVVVNWNTRELLLRLLESLRGAQHPLNAEVVVIDNGSSDESGNAVARRHPDVALIQNLENSGFARAANQGIRATSAKIVCLLNPDLNLDIGILEKCLCALESNPRIGALGPLLCQGNGQVWHYRDRYPSRMGLLADALLPFRSPGHLSSGRMIGSEMVEVDWLAGACLFLRRSALDQVGLLDERFFLYKEDVDLCLRLKRSGYLVVRHQGARLIHFIAASTRTNPGRESDRADLEGMRSSVLYASKLMGGVTGRFLAFAIRLSLLPRIAKATLLILLYGRDRDRRKFSWMWHAWCVVDHETPESRAAGREAV